MKGGYIEIGIAIGIERGEGRGRGLPPKSPQLKRFVTVRDRSLHGICNIAIAISGQHNVLTSRRIAWGD